LKEGKDRSRNLEETLFPQVTLNVELMRNAGRKSGQ
jgi:hypothetical protein